MSNEEYTHQSFAKESTMDAIEKLYSMNDCYLRITPLDLTLTPAMERTIRLHEEGKQLLDQFSRLRK